ncbi:MAG: LAS superfamily LD-carboxypeptidase LdcB [Flavobacteriales bacterium]|jgi:D-alanyl-D-alanine carboxypeptidase
MNRLFLLLLLLLPNIVLAQTPSEQELLGQFDQIKHPDFVLIENTHTSKDGIYLRKEAYSQFKLMADAAQKEGLNLQIISATRNFNYQKGIWERKWERSKYMGWDAFKKADDILNYSSMPGSSRHHWGTDIDLNSLNNDFFASGDGLKLYEWLSVNGPTFGFYQVYTSKEAGRTGYNEEKWHWSYLPLAKGYLIAFNELVHPENINGFKGSTLVDTLQIIPNYVNGIHYY